MEIAQLEVCDPDKIVESIRDNKFITERHGTYDNTSRVDIGLSRAEEIIANEMISFSPKMHTFTILGNNGKPNAVTVFPTEFCSCNAKDCLHLLAVKKSLGMDVTKKRVTNLTTLRGKDRKKKSGRKRSRPREGDYDYDVTPAPNSTVVNSEIDIETEPGVNVNDISMSGAEWIKIGKVILKDEEKKILESPNEWLNDRIIDAAQHLIKQKAPRIAGLQTCLNASKLTFRPVKGSFIQVINRNPEAGGSHWLTLSTVKCNRNGSEVKVHDSSFTSVSFPVQQSICNIMRRGTPPKRSDVIKVLFTDVSWQPNPNDCGLYAIANAVCDALGIDPTTQGYVTSEMRQHLISCFEKNKISPFPAYERKSIYTRGLRFQSVLKVFCTCRMPEDGLYVQCTKCKIWLHPDCEGLEEKDIPKEDTPYYCKKCSP